MKTKLFTLLLAVAASVGTMFAESGTCGENLTWDLTDGVLIISGTGDMTNWDCVSLCISGYCEYSSDCPWFDYRDNIEKVIIGNNVTSIGEDAFSQCKKLTSLTIPNSVTSIGGGAFSNCSGLTSIIIPNNVTSIGSYAFYYCTGLISLYIPNNVSYSGTLEGMTKLTSITAPPSFFDVAESNWASCPKYLEHVTVNNGELSDNGFAVISRSYKTLQSLDLSAASNTEMTDEAVKGFYNLQTLKLPTGLTEIGYMAVADCKNLQSIDIPASVTEISQSAFENCRSLKTITFGGSSSPAPGRFEAPAVSASQLQRIGNWAFYNCHELQNLTIPEGVTEIGDGAFYGCTYLEDLTLPSSVHAIGDNTFALCAKMKKIIVNAPVPPTIQAKTFFDVKRQIPVYVPDEVVDAYKDDTYWGEFDIQGVSHMPLGIDDVESGAKAQKLLRDNQVLILRGDKTYTLTGQEVK